MFEDTQIPAHGSGSSIQPPANSPSGSPPTAPVNVPTSSNTPLSGAKPSGEVVDVLADVEPTAKPFGTVNSLQLTSNISPMSPVSAVSAVNSQLPNVNSQPVKSGGFAGVWQNKKWLVIGGAVIILAVIALGVSAYLGTFSATTTTNNQQTTNNPSTDQGVSQQPTTPPAVAPLSTPETGLPGDDDRDGLTNEEEQKFGANPEVADTDGDGLSDYEEVKIYHTDPLKVDTDGDGYKDGDEVKNGYNPKGAGKLLDIDAALKAQQTTNNSQPTTPTTPTPTTGLPVNTGQ